MKLALPLSTDAFQPDRVRQGLESVHVSEEVTAIVEMSRTAERLCSSLKHFSSDDSGRVAPFVADLLTSPLKDTAQGLKSFAASKGILGRLYRANGEVGERVVIGQGAALPLRHPWQCYRWTWVLISSD